MKRIMKFFLLIGMFACFIVSFSYGETELYGEAECHSRGTSHYEGVEKYPITAGGDGVWCEVPEEGDCECDIEGGGGPEK